MWVCKGHRGDGVKVRFTMASSPGLAGPWHTMVCSQRLGSGQDQVAAASQLGDGTEPPRQPVCTDFLNDSGTDLHTM